MTRAYDVIGFGETMAMFVAEEAGDLAQVTRFQKRICGADSNVAIGLSRLGLKVAWVSRVGADSLGRFVISALEAEGLDCSRVSVDARYPTGMQFKARAAQGADPAVEYFRKGSAASHVSVADMDEALFASARHLHATGIPPAISATALELSEHAIKAMRAAGGTVSFDPNLRPTLWRDEATMRETLNRLAAGADWVLPGLDEGRLLTGRRTPHDIAGFYMDQGAQAVAIKLGPEGAYWRTADGEGKVVGFPVAKVVDTVGAGDGFATGFVSGRLEGLDIAAAVRRGCRLGSLAVQVVGDSEGLPTRAELERLERPSA
ncbi:MAG: 2-dehydro-3-deoxygluconokinase [Caulobacteraceae bacterium]|nr:2-dehydro-3-deoxygluconokinase [Caulobacteraceae bacterium]